MENPKTNTNVTDTLLFGQYVDYLNKVNKEEQDYTLCEGLFAYPYAIVLITSCASRESEWEFTLHEVNETKAQVKLLNTRIFQSDLSGLHYPLLADTGALSIMWNQIKSLLENKNRLICSLQERLASLETQQPTTMPGQLPTEIPQE